MTRVVLMLLLSLSFSTSYASCQKDIDADLTEALQYSKPLAIEKKGHRSRSSNDLRSGIFYLIPDILVNLADAGCWKHVNSLLTNNNEDVAKQLKHDYVDALIKHGFTEKAGQLIDSAEPNYVYGSLPAKLALQIAIQGDKEKAKNVVALKESKTHPKFVGSTTLEFIRLLVKNGLNEFAYNVASEDNTQYKQQSLIVVAGGYFKKGNVQQADRIIKNVLDSCRGKKGACDYKLFLIARAYIFAGKPNNALTYAKKIDSFGTKGQVLSELALHAKSGADALKVAEEAEKMIGTCTGPKCGYVAVRVAEAYGSAGAADKAISHLGNAYNKKDFNYRSGFEKTIRRLAMRGRRDDAYALLSKVEKGSFFMGNMKQAIAVSEIKVGNTNAALKLVMGTRNSYTQSNTSVTLAKMNPDIRVLINWLEKTKPDDLYIKMHARSTQILMAAAARNGQASQARDYVKTLKHPLVKARGLIGISQGLLGKSPGEKWARSLNKTW